MKIELEFPDDQAAAVIRLLQTLADNGVTCTILPTSPTAQTQQVEAKSV